MKTLFTFISAIFITNGLNAQAPNIDWETNLGGSGVDLAYSIRELSGGGYVVAGSTTSNDVDVSGNHGSGDMWMAILDANGNLINQYTYGGSNDEVAVDVRETADGGFLLAGYTESSDGDVGNAVGGRDIWIVRTFANGSIKWETVVGGSADEQAQSIQEIPGGKSVVVGYTASTDIGLPSNGGTDIIFLRLSNAGQPEAVKLYGGSGFDYGTDVQQTQDGGYIIGGYTTSNDGDVSGNNGGLDGWALKLDANASPNIQWQTCTGAGGDDKIFDIHEHSNGSYMMVGVSKVSATLSYFSVATLQPNGTISGQTTFGGTSGYGILYGLDEMPNGDYVVSGYTDFTDGDVAGNHGLSDIWVAGLASSGLLQWQKCLGAYHQEFGNAIIATSDGGAAVCGSSSSSTNGDVGGNNGGQDFWVVKLDAPLSTDEFEQSSFSIYPNPAKAYFTIDLGQNLNGNGEVSVSNLLGQSVFSSKMNDPQMQVTTNDWASGMYFVNISDETGVMIDTKKIIVE